MLTMLQCDAHVVVGCAAASQYSIVGTNSTLTLAIFYNRRQDVQLNRAMGISGQNIFNDNCFIGQYNCTSEFTANNISLTIQLVNISLQTGGNYWFRSNCSSDKKTLTVCGKWIALEQVTVTVSILCK